MTPLAIQVTGYHPDHGLLFTIALSLDGQWRSGHGRDPRRVGPVARPHVHPVPLHGTGGVTVADLGPPPVGGHPDARVAARAGHTATSARRSFGHTGHGSSTTAAGSACV